MGNACIELADAEVVIVSACLLGQACRYDGKDQRASSVFRATHGKAVVPLCPEVAGGLSIPRAPCSLHGGDGRAVLDGTAHVVTSDGRDATSAFVAGAAAAVDSARRFGATAAILKERSPSCGVEATSVGWGLASGPGVASAALARAGVAVVSSEALEGGE